MSSSPTTPKNSQYHTHSSLITAIVATCSRHKTSHTPVTVTIVPLSWWNNSRRWRCWWSCRAAANYSSFPMRGKQSSLEVDHILSRILKIVKDGWGIWCWKLEITPVIRRRKKVHNSGEYEGVLDLPGFAVERISKIIIISCSFFCHLDNWVLNSPRIKQGV